VSAAPDIELAEPRRSVLRLVVDSYATNPLDSKKRAREFALLGRLLAKVPAYRLQPHQDPALVGSLCELVIAREPAEKNTRSHIFSSFRAPLLPYFSAAQSSRSGWTLRIR